VSSGTGKDGAEIELKLAVPAEKLARLSRAPKMLALVGSAPGSRKRYVTTYFDTPDRRLAEAELALRVRRDGRRRIQTVKTAAQPMTAGLARGEWEREIVGEAPVIDDVWLAEIGDKAVRKLLAKTKVRGRLSPLFTTDFRRQAWRVHYGASDIELAFDKGEIAAGKGVVPIAEIELELKAGDPTDLYGLAREIAEIVPAVVESRSKAERGYALLAKRANEGRAVRARPLDLGTQPTVADAFIQIGRSCFRHLRANESLVRGKPFVEGVHQLRVALRRLRSALAAFRDVLPEDERKRMSEELRWIASSCGQARDWDVFRTQLLKPLAEHLDDDPALAGVSAAAERLRKRAYAEVSATLASPRLTAALLDVEAWWEKGAWARSMGAWAKLPAGEFAAATLKKLHRKAASLGAQLADLEEVELHELRIRCKKLRYAAEFFRGIFPRKSAETYLEALADVQEHLGSLNDAVVAKTLLAKLGKSSRDLPAAVLAHADGIVTGWVAARVKADLDELPDVWVEFERRKPFWK
jgi:inorganic triphosphatase YgiF